MKLKAMLGAAVALALVTGARADILVGQTVGVTGAVAATVKESMLGAQMTVSKHRRIRCSSIFFNRRRKSRPAQSRLVPKLRA